MQQWWRNVRMTRRIRTIKTSLERGFRLSSYFFIKVLSLHLVDLNISLPNLYIIMYRSAHCILKQLINQS